MTADTDRKLASALRALADETSGGGPSPAVQDNLLDELRARRRPAAVWPRWAIAACVFPLAALLFFLPVRKEAPVAVSAPAPLELPVAGTETAIAPVPAAVPVQRAVMRRQVLTPWYYNQALPPARSGQVLRVKVARDIAHAFGVSAPASSGLVQADLLIGEDGMTRAIRFVQ